MRHFGVHAAKEASFFAKLKPSPNPMLRYGIRTYFCFPERLIPLPFDRSYGATKTFDTHTYRVTNEIGRYLSSRAAFDTLA
jgi:hypothetical protein